MLLTRAGSLDPREEAAHVPCGIGSWGAQCLSMGDYVMGVGPTTGATVAGGC
jgi:hypothetical protein